MTPRGAAALINHAEESQLTFAPAEHMDQLYSFAGSEANAQ